MLILDFNSSLDRDIQQWRWRLPGDYLARKGLVVWRDRHGQKLQEEVVGYLRNFADIVRDAGTPPIFIIEAAPIEHQMIDHDLEEPTGVRPLLYERNWF